MNILITGASRGIGREFVHQYLKYPKLKTLFVITQNPEKMADLQKEHGEKLRLIATSVSKPESRKTIEEAIQSHSIDLLINNAGAYFPEPDEFLEIELKTVLDTIDVNAISTIRACQACVPSLKRAEANKINPKVIQISSLMGSIGDNGMGGSFGYRMSKCALNMFNKSFSIEFPNMISVVLHPGWVKTDMGGDQAPTSVEESVSGMMKVIEGLTLEDTGKFIDHEGDVLPW